MCHSVHDESAAESGASPGSPDAHPPSTADYASVPLSLPARALLALIHAYRLILSPWLGGRCRFIPSCSEYGLLAIRKYGAWKGGWKTLGRIIRCQPFCQGGVDFP